MKKFSILLPMIALIIGISASAFTAKSNALSDLVWFELDETTGAPVNTSNGIQGDEPPSFMDCGGSSLYCSKALSIVEDEVVANGNGTYSIASGVSIQQDYNEHREKE